MIFKVGQRFIKDNKLCTNCGKQPPTLNRVKCDVCLLAARESCKKYIKENPKAKEVKNRWKNNLISRAKNRESRKKWRTNYRIKVLNLLGSICECCGEGQFEFLQIDHVNKDGYIHRKEKRGTHLLRDIYHNPTKFKLRVLCANCHFALT